MQNEDIDIWYFRKELDYLHKSKEVLLGRYPKLVPFLAYNSQDPDVGHIIEALAILSGKIHKELDANIPFIAESLINILIPNYTNALPSLCMQEFALKSDAKSHKIIIPKNTTLKSTRTNGVHCEFKTIYDVYVYPLRLSDVVVGSEGRHSALTLDIELSRDDISLSDIALDYLTLYLGNDVYTANTLLLWLMQYLKDIILIAYDSNEQFSLAPQSLQHIGLQENESLLDNNDIGFSSFASLQELLLLPEKFHFLKLCNLELTQTLQTKKIGIKFIFSKELPKDCLPKLKDFSLAATPIINLFAAQAEPLLLDRAKNDEYRIFVDRAHNASYAVIQVLRVKAHSADSGRRVLKNYNSFERFAFLEHNTDFYSIANKQDSQGEHYKVISFYTAQFHKETISIDVLCSNGALPASLKLGDINQIPAYKDIITHNLSTPTSIRHISIDNALSWKLISTLCFSYQTMLSKESFLSVIHTYSTILSSQDFFAILSESLLELQAKTIYNINGFITQRGTLVTMHIEDSKFYCIGEVYKMGLVFSKFFASFAPINSFCELRIICTSSNTTFHYTATQGNKALL